MRSWRFCGTGLTSIGISETVRLSTDRTHRRRTTIEVDRFRKTEGSDSSHHWMGCMTAQKNMSPDEIKRRLIRDAESADAWESLGSVRRSPSPRPSWYGHSTPKLAVGEPTRASDTPDDARFKAAYQRHNARVIRYYIRAFGVSADEAGELAVQTFARFHEALDHDRGEAEWAFLETIVRNVAYDRVRTLKSASRSAQVVRIDDARARRQAAPPSPEATHEREARHRKQLHDAIAELPEGQRHAVQLWLDGFHYGDIARALDVSIDAIKSRLREAKRHLRKTLEDGDDPGATLSGRRTGGAESR